MNPTPEKESDIEAFSSKLLTLTMEANRELIKCNDLRDYLDANAELLEKTYHTRAYAVARTCTYGATVSQCGYIANDDIQCGCPHAVNATDKLDAIRSNYNTLGCTGLCHGLVCAGSVVGGSCGQSTSGAGTCIDQLSGGPL